MPVIHLVQPTDAPQYSGKLRDIFNILKAENRITGYQLHSSEDDLTPLIGKLTSDDMVIAMLTHGIEADKDNIQSNLTKIMDEGVKVAEVIVDLIAYEKEFLTYPLDLKPLRDREDLNDAWEKIANQLRDVFPVIEPEKKIPWVKIAAGLVVLGFLYFLITKVEWGKQPQADFSYKIHDPISGDIFDDTSACYTPCLISLTQKSTDFETLTWHFNDTSLMKEENPEYLLIRPGVHKVHLVAAGKGKESSKTESITVKAPPIIDFEIDNYGCTAPCEVRLINRSKNAIEYQWELTAGTPNEFIGMDPPKIRFEENEDGVHKVKLTITNVDGIRVDTTREIKISKDNSPIANFRIKYGKITGNQRQVTFQNQSKNASKYLWNLGKGGPPKSVNSKQSQTGTYQIGVKYIVTLVAQNGNFSNTFFQDFTPRKGAVLYNPNLYNIDQKTLDALKKTSSQKYFQNLIGQ